MIRPAERFAVNITPEEPALRLSRPSPWLSPPMLIALAAVLGVGLGGMLPSAWISTDAPRTAAVAPPALLPATIEPAAGPPTVVEVLRAPEERGHAPALADRLPDATQIEPTAAPTR